MVTLAIVYEPENGTALRVAQVRDELLLLEAARIAIEEAETGAATIAQHDSTLGRIQTAEAEKLRDVLGLLLPELSLQNPVNHLKM
jgi:hypothetical protein